MAPILREVHLWPHTGHPDVRWSPPRPPDESDWPLLEMDAILRGSRKISEPLGERLAEQRIEMPSASIRLFPGGASASTDLEVEISRIVTDGENTVHFAVPAGFHNLDVRARDELVLTMWTETLRRLVSNHGGDPAAVSRATDALRGVDYEEPRRGPWKQNPARSHRMRLIGVLKDDGYFRLRVEVEHLGGGRPPVLSETIVGDSTFWSFDRAARDLRWTSSSSVEGVSIPGILLGDRGRFTLDVATGAVHLSGGFTTPLPIEPTGPAVGAGFRFIEQPADDVYVGWGGGGPVNDVPAEYLAEVDRLADRLCSPEWKQWWRLVGVDQVSGYVNYEPPRETPIVRLVNKSLTMIVRRSVAKIPTGPEAEQLARQDLEAALTRLAARQKVELPPL